MWLCVHTETLMQSAETESKLLQSCILHYTLQTAYDPGISVIRHFFNLDTVDYVMIIKYCTVASISAQSCQCSDKILKKLHCALN